MPFSMSPIAEVERCCSALAFSRSEFEAACIRSITSANLSALLRNATLAPELELVARDSYLHDNGFAKIVVYRSDHCAVRFHLWDTSQASVPVTSNVHDHRWHFVAMLLSGGYLQQQFRRASLSQKGSQYSASRYTVSGDEYELAPIGELRLIKTDENRIQPGQHYMMMADSLHRVIVPVNQVTVSVVFQAATIKQSTTVCAEQLLPHLVRKRSHGMSTADLLYSIELIRRTCGLNWS